MKAHRRTQWSKPAAFLALAGAFASFGAGRTARADEPEGRETREARLGVLAIYTAAAGAVVGGSYLLRDDLVGRSVATAAAGWGGLCVGAAAGWALTAAAGCHDEDCTDADNVGALAGGLLGAAAGSIAGYFLTRHDGMSRVYTTGAGMAPFALILGVATVAQW